jgi:hypothetical protein
MEAAKAQNWAVEPQEEKVFTGSCPQSLHVAVVNMETETMAHVVETLCCFIRLIYEHKN